jgi:hypothetical protein
MAKKDFTAAAAATERVKEVMNTAQDTATAADLTEEPIKKRKSRRTYSDEEREEFIASGATSGRKGLKLSRINMAFTSENYEFIQVMARVRGETLTSFVNDMVSKYREEHGELYRKAIEFRESL